MPRGRIATAFLVAILFISGASFAAAQTTSGAPTGGDAADKQCPKAGGSIVYLENQSHNTTIRINNTRYFNAWGKPCEDTENKSVAASGECVLKLGEPKCQANKCDGKDCKLPDTNTGSQTGTKTPEEVANEINQNGTRPEQQTGQQITDQIQRQNIYDALSASDQGAGLAQSGGQFNEFLGEQLNNFVSNQGYDFSGFSNFDSSGFTPGESVVSNSYGDVGGISSQAAPPSLGDEMGGGNFTGSPANTGFAGSSDIGSVANIAPQQSIGDELGGAGLPGQWQPSAPQASVATVPVSGLDFNTTTQLPTGYENLSNTFAAGANGQWTNAPTNSFNSELTLPSDSQIAIQNVTPTTGQALSELSEAAPGAPVVTNNQNLNTAQNDVFFSKGKTEDSIAGLGGGWVNGTSATVSASNYGTLVSGADVPGLLNRNWTDIAREVDIAQGPGVVDFNGGRTVEQQAQDLTEAQRLAAEAAAKPEQQAPQAQSEQAPTAPAKPETFTEWASAKWDELTSGKMFGMGAEAKTPTANSDTGDQSASPEPRETSNCVGNWCATADKQISASQCQTNIEACSQSRVGEASVYMTAGEKPGNRSGDQSSSGVTLDAKAPTVASQTLPNGTIVNITNQDNGKSVQAVVTDSGQFTTLYGREVDMSPAVAKALGINGLGNVQVDPVALPTESCNAACTSAAIASVRSVNAGNSDAASAIADLQSSTGRSWTIPAPSTPAPAPEQGAGPDILAQTNGGLIDGRTGVPLPQANPLVNVYANETPFENGFPDSARANQYVNQTTFEWGFPDSARSNQYANTVAIENSYPDSQRANEYANTTPIENAYPDSQRTNAYANATPIENAYPDSQRANEYANTIPFEVGYTEEQLRLAAIDEARANPVFTDSLVPASEPLDVLSRPAAEIDGTYQFGQTTVRAQSDGITITDQTGAESFIPKSDLGNQTLGQAISNVNREFSPYAGQLPFESGYAATQPNPYADQVPFENGFPDSQRTNTFANTPAFESGYAAVDRNPYADQIPFENAYPDSQRGNPTANATPIENAYPDSQREIPNANATPIENGYPNANQEAINNVTEAPTNDELRPDVASPECPTGYDCAAATKSLQKNLGEIQTEINANQVVMDQCNAGHCPLTIASDGQTILSDAEVKNITSARIVELQSKADTINNQITSLQNGIITPELKQAMRPEGAGAAGLDSFSSIFKNPVGTNSNAATFGDNSFTRGVDTVLHFPRQVVGGWFGSVVDSAGRLTSEGTDWLANKTSDTFAAPATEAVSDFFARPQDEAIKNTFNKDILQTPLDIANVAAAPFMGASRAGMSMMGSGVAELGAGASGAVALDTNVALRSGAAPIVDSSWIETASEIAPAARAVETEAGLSGSAGSRPSGAAPADLGSQSSDLLGNVPERVVAEAPRPTAPAATEAPRPVEVTPQPTEAIETAPKPAEAAARPAETVETGPRPQDASAPPAEATPKETAPATQPTPSTEQTWPEWIKEKLGFGGKPEVAEAPKPAETAVPEASTPKPTEASAAPAEAAPAEAAPAQPPVAKSSSWFGDLQDSVGNGLSSIKKTASDSWDTVTTWWRGSAEAPTVADTIPIQIGTNPDVILPVAEAPRSVPTFTPESIGSIAEARPSIPEFSSTGPSPVTGKFTGELSPTNVTGPTGATLDRGVAIPETVQPQGGLRTSLGDGGVAPATQSSLDSQLAQQVQKAAAEQKQLTTIENQITQGATPRPAVPDAAQPVATQPQSLTDRIRSVWNRITGNEQVAPSAPSTFAAPENIAADLEKAASAPKTATDIAPVAERATPGYELPPAGTGEPRPTLTMTKNAPPDSVEVAIKNIDSAKLVKWDPEAVSAAYDPVSDTYFFRVSKADAAELEAMKSGGPAPDITVYPAERPASGVAVNVGEATNITDATPKGWISRTWDNIKSIWNDGLAGLGNKDIGTIAEGTAAEPKAVVPENAAGGTSEVAQAPKTGEVAEPKATAPEAAAPKTEPAGTGEPAAPKSEPASEPVKPATAETAGAKPAENPAPEKVATAEKNVPPAEAANPLPPAKAAASESVAETAAAKSTQALEQNVAKSTGTGWTKIVPNKYVLLGLGGAAVGGGAAYMSTLGFLGPTPYGAPGSASATPPAGGLPGPVAPTGSGSPTVPTAAAPAQGPCPNGSVINADGTCPGGAPKAPQQQPAPRTPQVPAPQQKQQIQNQGLFGGANGILGAIFGGLGQALGKMMGAQSTASNASGGATTQPTTPTTPITPTGAQSSVSLVANPSTITAGQKTTLVWAAVGPTQCTVTDPASHVVGTGNPNPDPKNPVVLTLSTSTMFTIACGGGSGNATGQVTVTVR